MSDRMQHVRIYFRVVDKGGKSWVEERMAWDPDRLTLVVYEQHYAEGGSALRITEEQYRREKSSVRS